MPGSRPELVRATPSSGWLDSTTRRSLPPPASKAAAGKTGKHSGSRPRVQWRQKLCQAFAPVTRKQLGRPARHGDQSPVPPWFLRPCGVGRERDSFQYRGRAGTRQVAAKIEEYGREVDRSGTNLATGAAQRAGEWKFAHGGRIVCQQRCEDCSDRTAVCGCTVSGRPSIQIVTSCSS